MPHLSKQLRIREHLGTDRKNVITLTKNFTKKNMMLVIRETSKSTKKLFCIKKTKTSQLSRNRVLTVLRRKKKLNLKIGFLSKISSKAKSRFELFWFN